MTLSEDSQEKVQRLQLIEQKVQSINLQKQQFQTQLFEIDSALTEVVSSNVAYKLIGGIMVDTDKDVLKKDLESKKELLNLRLETLEKQEKKEKETAEKLREEVMASVKN